jgi:hypothetical protein
MALGHQSEAINFYDCIVIGHRLNWRRFHPLKWDFGWEGESSFMMEVSLIWLMGMMVHLELWSLIGNYSLESTVADVPTNHYPAPSNPKPNQTSRKSDGENPNSSFNSFNWKWEQTHRSTSGFHSIHIQLTCHSQVERFERFIFVFSIFFPPFPPPPAEGRSAVSWSATTHEPFARLRNLISPPIRYVWEHCESYRFRFGFTILKKSLFFGQSRIGFR